MKIRSKTILVLYNRTATSNKTSQDNFFLTWVVVKSKISSWDPSLIKRKINQVSVLVALDPMQQGLKPPVTLEFTATIISNTSTEWLVKVQEPAGGKTEDNRNQTSVFIIFKSILNSIPTMKTRNISNRFVLIKKYKN